MMTIEIVMIEEEEISGGKPLTQTQVFSGLP